MQFFLSVEKVGQNLTGAFFLNRPWVSEEHDLFLLTAVEHGQLAVPKSVCQVLTNNRLGFQDFDCVYVINKSPSFQKPD